MLEPRHLRSTRGICALFACALALGGVALSAGATEQAPREKAELLLTQAAEDPSGQGLVERAVAQSRQALSRSDALAAQGSEGPIELLDALALEWAEVARDLLRTRSAEQAAETLEQELLSVKAELSRSRAAVEQAQARVGRARQELSELEAAPAGQRGSAP